MTRCLYPKQIETLLEGCTWAHKPTLRSAALAEAHLDVVGAAPRTEAPSSVATQCSFLMCVKTLSGRLWCMYRVAPRYLNSSKHAASAAEISTGAEEATVL